MNVLVAAFRRDHTHHGIAINWLDRARGLCAEGSASLTLLPIVVVGFLRLVTNPRIFIDPDAIEDAVSFVDALLSSPASSFRRTAPSGLCFVRSCSPPASKATM